MAAEAAHGATPAASTAGWDDDILVIVDTGTHTRAAAERLVALVEELVADRPPGTVRVLVDLRNSDGVAPQARDVFRRLVGHEAFGPVAFAVESTFMRVAATFVIKAAGKRDTKVFEQMEGAVQWLRGA